jgi:hypothetical protein
MLCISEISEKKNCESYTSICLSMDEKCTFKGTENKYLSKNWMNEWYIELRESKYLHQDRQRKFIEKCRHIFL